MTEELRRHYAQVFELGHKIGHDEWSLSDRSGDLTRAHQVLGVNIGQSYIKAVYLDASGGTRRVRRKTFEGTSRSPAQRVEENVSGAIKQLVGSSEAISAIGVSTGGIVLDGKIQPNSGITAAMANVDTELVTEIPVRLGNDFAAPVVVAQDVEAKAKYHSASFEGRNVLVLDVGTSIGGSYLSARKVVPRMLNQVGRLAVDVSSEAAQRSDGRGTGLMSQYLSAKGIATFLASKGRTILSTTDLEENLATLPEKLENALGERLYSHLTECSKVLSLYYQIDALLLSGGVTAHPLFRRIISNFTRVAPFEVAVSTEPVYDSAIGVALLAGTVAS